MIIITSIIIIKQNIVNKTLKIRLIYLLIFNIIIFIIPDNTIYKERTRPHEIPWGKEINWDDFEGKKNTSVIDAAASINSGTFLKYNKAYNYPRYVTKSLMNKKLSWVNPELKWLKGNLFKHELLHFEITEWTRLKLVDSLSKRKKINQKIAYDIHDYFISELIKTQAEYDSFSKHGTDYNGQIFWNKKVKKQTQH